MLSRFPILHPGLLKVIRSISLALCCSSAVACADASIRPRESDSSNRAAVSKALRVVADSLTPMYADSGKVRPITHFYVDPGTSRRAQERASPQLRLSAPELTDAVRATSLERGSWGIRAQTDLIACKSGSRVACRMDPSIAVMTVGTISHESDGRVRVSVSSTQMAPNEWRLHVVGHSVLLELHAGFWKLVDYRQTGHS